MAKRSPILGYNHNVRYRGLILHVQTEDSGLLSPHLFTHLFYEGVIIATRKLVYDAGSDEGAIKSLMQAQHKAVMKDLRRGAFDDKMDTNLAGNPGLLPRGARETGEAPPLRESEPVLPGPEIPMPQAYLTEPGIEIIADEPSAPIPMMTNRADTEHTPMPLDLLQRAGTEPIDLPDELASNVTQPIDVLEELMPPPAIARTMTPPPIPQAARSKTPAPMTIQPRNGRADSEPVAARTKTAEKTSPKSGPRGTLPPPPSADLDPPTITEDPAALAAQMFASADARPFASESAPEIEIYAEDPPRRRTRDTELENSAVQAVDEGPRFSDGVPQSREGSRDLPPPMPRPPTHSAATLPPSRPLTRPPSRGAIVPPVLPRPITAEQLARARSGESDAVDVYAPPPSAHDPSPSERPGQYSQHRRTSVKMIAVDPPTPPPRERSGSVSSSAPIPSGLGRPLRPSESHKPLPIPRPVPREQTPSTSSSGVPQPMSPQQTLPRGKPLTPSRERAPTPGRTPTPSRIQSTQPMQRPSGSGGVVMTRPAVIVGAPAKPTTQRVRKAREEEGRGFGQGLISEKSLDEVILAYLSEDADDK